MDHIKEVTAPESQSLTPKYKKGDYIELPGGKRGFVQDIIGENYIIDKHIKNKDRSNRLDPFFVVPVDNGGNALSHNFVWTPKFNVGDEITYLSKTYEVLSVEINNCVYELSNLDDVKNELFDGIVVDNGASKLKVPTLGQIGRQNGFKAGKRHMTRRGKRTKKRKQKSPKKSRRVRRSKK